MKRTTSTSIPYTFSRTSKGYSDKRYVMEDKHFRALQQRQENVHDVQLCRFTLGNALMIKKRTHQVHHKALLLKRTQERWNVELRGREQ